MVAEVGDAADACTNNELTASRLTGTLQIVNSGQRQSFFERGS
jgi:hypothetical protein